MLMDGGLAHFLRLLCLLTASLEGKEEEDTLDLLSRLHHRGSLPSSSHPASSLLLSSSPSFPLFSILSKTSYTTTGGTSPLPQETTTTTTLSPSGGQEEEEENPLEDLETPPHLENSTVVANETLKSTLFLGLNQTELALSAGALLLLLLSGALFLLAYFLCKSHFYRRNIYTTMDEHEFNPLGSHFTHPGPPIILDHEHKDRVGAKPKRK